jgi:glutathione S-transferase
MWIAFPDVEHTLRSLGAPPSAYRDGRPVFTLPVLVDPTPRHTQVLSNVNNIAEYLEAAYPARPVFPEGSRAMQTLFVHYIQEVFAKPLLPIMVPISHPRLPSSQHGSAAGTAFPGHSSSQMQVHQAGPQREHAWMMVKEQFNFLAGILEKNVGDGDGTVAQGHSLSYADFAICSVLIWIETMAPSDGWVRVRDWNGGRWSRLRDRCREYMDVV